MHARYRFPAVSLRDRRLIASTTSWSRRRQNTLKALGPGLLLLFFPALATAAGGIFPVSDPGNKGGWVLNESLSDEFDGSVLDLKKWNNLGLNGNYFGEWQGRAPSQYNPANVSVGGGNLTITSKWDPDFKFSDAKCSNGRQYGKPAPITTACITSNAKFKYGYLEMRCKAADGPVSSSFWTTGSGGEIDVFEHFGEHPADKYVARRFHTSFHDWRKDSPMFGKRIWTNVHQLDFRVADDFHIYGLNWDENFVAIYVDGRLVGYHNKATIGDKWVASSEQKVWIDSETFDWEVPPDQLKASDFGDGQEFVIDYCRIWQSTLPSPPMSPRTNLISNASFETAERTWKGSASLTDDQHWGERAAELKGSSTIEQVVAVKPNTTYVLSGWAKSPRTNEKDKWFNAFLGVREHGNADTNVRFFLPGYHFQSVEFTTGPASNSATIYFTNDPHGESAFVDDIELFEAVDLHAVDLEGKAE